MTGDYFALQKKIYRWSDRTRFVLVYIASADYLPDWRPWHAQLVRDAFAEWQRALDNRLMFVFVSGTDQADVIVNWWNAAQPGVEAGACGLNQLKTWGRYIARNDIYLSLHRQDGVPWPAGELYVFALHEIGHMIGIREHSDYPLDVMAARTEAQTRLTARDIATMKRIYSVPADYSNPSGYHLSRFEDFQKTRKKSIWLPVPFFFPL